MHHQSVNIRCNPSVEAHACMNPEPITTPRSVMCLHGKLKTCEQLISNIGERAIVLD